MLIPVVKGYTMRISKVDACGKPIEGSGHRIVTDGYISAKLTPEMEQRQVLKQPNAEGRIIVKDTTPATRQHHNIDLQFAGIDPDVLSLLASYARVLDYNGKAIGFDDKSTVDDEFGAAIEIWTGGSSSEDCPIPTDDSIFSVAGNGQHYGYLLFGGKEFVMTGDISVAAAIGTFGIGGITMALPQWCRGPYNVAAIDSDGTPGRMLTPMGADNHVRFFRTMVAPPEVTAGAVPLGVKSLFTAANSYCGESALDVAPDQVDTVEYTLAFTGGPATAGSAEVLLDGEPVSIAWNSTNTAAKTALVAVDDGLVASDITVTGGALPGTPLVITLPVGVTLAKGTNSLTGGTSPDFTVTQS